MHRTAQVFQTAQTCRGKTLGGHRYGLFPHPRERNAGSREGVRHRAVSPGRRLRFFASGSPSVAGTASLWKLIPGNCSGRGCPGASRHCPKWGDGRCRSFLRVSEVFCQVLSCRRFLGSSWRRPLGCLYLGLSLQFLPGPKNGHSQASLSGFSQGSGSLPALQLLPVRPWCGPGAPVAGVCRTQGAAQPLRGLLAGGLWCSSPGGGS